MVVRVKFVQAIVFQLSRLTVVGGSLRLALASRMILCGRMHANLFVVPFLAGKSVC
jgi:hypothetical protein